MHLASFPLLFLIPLLPLIGAVYNGLLGVRMQKRFGEAAVHWPAILLPWGSFVIALAAFVSLAGQGHGAALYQNLWGWIRIGSLDADVAFLMDRLSGVMCLVVTFVGSLIHIYSVGYMRKDPSYWRFFCYLNLFMFAMLTLVMADNLVLMFVGWEGVGLCSYLLISFWYKEREKAVAGMKAFIVNRIGDYGFSLGLFLLFWGLLAAPATSGRALSMHASEGVNVQAAGSIHGQGGALETPGAVSAHEAGAAPAADAVHAHDAGAGGAAPSIGTSVAFRHIEALLADPGKRAGMLDTRVLGISLLTLAALLFFLGATGKSAQIPLHVWLPDAMAGPTPVSALIHAATMVTAGVYMVARLHFVFALSPTAMTVVATVGALTALFAATIGLFQYDIKKVLAYSTVSQLGFMFVAAGIGAYWVAIFHLMTHAFFKACLFLGSGSVIVGCHHEQDMRRMGGLRKLMPVTALTYLLACAAIAGFPFFSGFFSKDEILWKAFDTGNLLLPGGGVILYVIAALAALGTSFYMFRSYYMTFSGAYRGAQPAHADADMPADAHDHAPADAHGHGHAALPQESPRSMTWVLVILAALAVVGGYVGLPHLWGLPNLFEHWLEPVFAGSSDLIRSADKGTGAEWTLMILSVALAFGGFLFARALYRDAKSRVPARLLASPNPLVRGVHKTIFNKYYVDEAYQALFVNRALQLANGLSWWDAKIIDGIVNLVGTLGRAFSLVQGWIDDRFVDGLVNRVGAIVSGAGRRLRRIQTGQIQSYVYGLTAGAVALLVLAYILNR
ncbi:MAG: NADH-quinone oxidoreductase subunit L [Candidatus Eisenbacteria bacterium]|nr:NADH-quinone oxidoreductase subunit L [Candidatus Eisenbacteria bacterium]